MAWTFSNSLLADAIWLEARRRNMTIEEAAYDMSTDRVRVSRESLCRLRSTEVHPKVASLTAMLTWLGRWDLSEFLIDDETVRVGANGLITVERLAWEQHRDHRVTIGRRT